MKNLLIISLIIISSCSKKIDLKGEWKASVLVINNSEEKEDPFRAITHFKADNFVIYFESPIKSIVSNYYNIINSVMINSFYA